jgi:hypothetical protein
MSAALAGCARLPEPAVPEQPEPTVEETRAANKRGLWVILVLAAIAIIIVAVIGLEDIFVGAWR